MIEQAVRDELSYDVRVVGMREAIDQMKAVANVMRVATLRLVDVDCQGAVDVASHALYEVHKATDTLERQLRDLLSVESAEGRTPSDANPQEIRSAATSSVSLLTLSRTGRLGARRGRRIGIDIIPGSVRRAREQAGLSLAEVAGDKVTRVAVWYIERGRSRPSLETLQLIAEKTRKPLSYFVGANPPSLPDDDVPSGGFQ